MDKAERIVQAIERDFTDRGGLRQEWEQIDAEIQEEIRATWTALVRKELDSHTKMGELLGRHRALAEACREIDEVLKANIRGESLPPQGETK